MDMIPWGHISINNADFMTFINIEVPRESIWGLNYCQMLLSFCLSLHLD